MRPTFEMVDFDWHGIAVSVGISRPTWLEACREVTGTAFVHMEIHATAPLPITETGYLSHFLAEEVLAEEGGPKAFVRAWLDVMAAQPAWRDRPQPSTQLSLF